MNRLSQKEKGFIEDIVKGETGTQAALNNYDTDNEDTAAVIASQNLGKLKIQNAIKSIAESIPDELLLKVHLEGLNAHRIVNEEVEPDYAVRHKYLDTAHKIKGTYAPEKSINLNLDTEITNPAARELAEEYERKLKQSL